MALDASADAANRARKRDLDKPEVPPLDPPFPFVRQPFDPFFFGLEKEPARPGEARPDGSDSVFQ